MSYRDDVDSDAKSFIQEHSDIFKDALAEGVTRGHEVEFDYNGEFHEAVTDRSYTLQDAAVILAECDNEESDSGLWESLDPKEAICVQAAYSYSNDVRAEVHRIFENDLVDAYDDRVEKLADRLQELDDQKDSDRLTDEEESERATIESSVEQMAAEQVMNEFCRPAPVDNTLEPCSEEERDAIVRWFRLGRGSARAGYPLGGAYIDARCGSGHGMPEEKAYVDYDNELAALLPDLAGKYSWDVMEYLKTVHPKAAKELDRSS